MCARRNTSTLVKDDPEFEAASNPPMSAICIRYTGVNEADAVKLHADVAERVEKSGRFWIGTTELKGKMWFRINPVNFRTRQEHMEQLLRLLRKECRVLASSVA